MTKPAKPTPHAVKDAMVRRETDWLRTLGGTVSSRDVESRVNRGMERLYARKREAKPKAPGPVSGTSDRRQQRRKALEEKSGGKIWVKPARPVAQRGPKCGNCGLCFGCKRAARLRKIQELGRQGDLACSMLAWDAYALTNALLSGGTYKDVLGNVYAFGEMHARDRRRASNAAFERILDRSVNVSGLGEWR